MNKNTSTAQVAKNKKTVPRKTGAKKTTTKPRKKRVVKSKQSLVVTQSPRKTAKKVPTSDVSRIGGILSKVNLPAVMTKNPLTLFTSKPKDNIDGKLELAFKHLHREFNQREKQLEQRMQEIHLQHTLLLEKKHKRLKWLLPLGLLAALAGGYMLFVLTNMQNSMSTMTGSIDGMNGYMANMSNDTALMSQNIQMMNNSMYQMNGNVKGMSDSIEPMGDMAKTTSPFMKSFSAFLPF